MNRAAEKLHALADRLAAAAKTFAQRPEAVSVQVMAGDAVVIFVVRCAGDDVERVAGYRHEHINALREHVCAEARRFGLRAYVALHGSRRIIRVGVSGLKKPTITPRRVQSARAGGEGSA